LKGKGAEKAIAKRVEQIKDQIENSTSEYEKEKMQERMARLASGVAILKVIKRFYFETIFLSLYLQIR
jgi:chaperonin GroEL